MTTTFDPAPVRPERSLTRGERTAARLRDAATEAFAELGWSATRVEDIVQRAGVSHGTFYVHYENKAAVLEHLARTSQEDLRALAEAPWEAGAVHAALERVIGGFLDLYARDVSVMRTLVEAARNDDSFHSLLLDMRERFVHRVSRQLAEMVATSDRGAPSVAAVAASLVAMVEHTAYTWLVLGEAHERADVVDALVLVWGSALNTLAGRRIFTGR